jgi:hypothetical protein
VYFSALVYCTKENLATLLSGHLLFWHDKIFDVTGVGSIVRVLADRNKV